MIVERLHEDDWERLAREEGFREMHWRMRLRSSAWLVARDDDGADVGLVCVIQEPGADETERHVVSFWVRPEARRRGAGRALLQAAARSAAADGARRLTLWLVRGNEDAAAAYRAVGFAPTGEAMPLPRDPSRTEERWALALDGAR